MLQKRSATPRRMIIWIAAAVIIILLGALWLFSDRQPSTSKAPDQQLAKTVFRKKIVPDRKLSARTVTKKIAAKPPAVIETQQSPEANTPAKPPAPIKTEQPEKEKTVSPEPTISAPLKIDSQPKTSLQQEAKPMPETPVPVIAKTATREIRREKWLLSQDAASYTIQIIGVSYEKSMLNFINKNQLLKQNEIAYYESTFNDKPWYQLLYGIYPTKQDARLAAEKLPEDIRQKTGPWIRRLSGVQQTIEK